MNENLSYAGVATCAFCIGAAVIAFLSFWLRYFVYESSGFDDLDWKLEKLAERLYGDD
jgi:hypothetical protein